MPGIPDDTINEVRAASDLVDVVSDRVRLKKVGREYKGLCPFHNEKTPSFHVVPDKEFYHCFGCGKSGDVFRFVQETETVGFLDAVRLLADRAGIEIREGAPDPDAERKEAMNAVLRFAARYFYRTMGTPEGERGLAYVKGRGFSPDAVKEFAIGVAPAGWDGLVRAATEAGYKPETLVAVGLAKERGGGGGHYDAFRDRLMFPIFSSIGKVLGFGGRILPDTETGSEDYVPAKYINSPETDVYRKSRVLYGLKHAKRAIRTEREAVVVEGYADVVSLWDAGVRNVVAASGTALTAGQIDLLKRLDVQRLVLLFDADAAGQSAAQKGIVAALDGGLAPYAVSLPDGADPDSFVRQFGADAFRAVLRDERQDFVAFLVARARQAGALDTPEGKSEAVRGVLRAVKRVGDPIQQAEYLRLAAGALDVYETDLRRQFDGTAAPRARERPEPGPSETPPPAAEANARPEERSLVRLMLEHGLPMVEHVLTRMGVDEFTPGPPRDIVQAVIGQFEAGAIDADAFVRGEHGEAARRFVTETLAERHSLSDNWHAKVGVDAPGRDKDPFKSAASAMRLLKLDRVQEAIEARMSEMQSRERAGQDITGLQGEVNGLNELRREIESNAFMTWDG